jgi:hypothetical protein
MQGVVRGTNDKGDLAFVGEFKNGTPSGIQAKEKLKKWFYFDDF